MTDVMTQPPFDPEDGKVGKYLLFWLLGVPIPILLIVYFFSNGC